MTIKEKEKEKETVQSNLGTPAWKREERGAKVEAGKNWVTGLTHEQRVMHMTQHENFWKKKYNLSQNGLQQNWMRG